MLFLKVYFSCQWYFWFTLCYRPTLRYNHSHFFFKSLERNIFAHYQRYSFKYTQNHYCLRIFTICQKYYTSNFFFISLYLELICFNLNKIYVIKNVYIYIYISEYLSYCQYFCLQRITVKNMNIWIYYQHDFYTWIPCFVPEYPPPHPLPVPTTNSMIRLL